MAQVSNTDPDHLPDEYEPMYSFDNTNIHCDASALVGKAGTGSHALLPPFSPDMHKVIEHIFNPVSHILHTRVFPDMVAALGPNANPELKFSGRRCSRCFRSTGGTTLAASAKTLFPSIKLTNGLLHTVACAHRTA